MRTVWAVPLVAWSLALALPLLAGAQQATPPQGVTPAPDAVMVSDGGDDHRLTILVTLISGAVTIAGALGGVYLGHQLSERAAREWEARADAKQRRGVRAVLRIEIASTSRNWTGFGSGSRVYRARPASRPMTVRGGWRTA